MKRKQSRPTPDDTDAASGCLSLMADGGMGCLLDSCLSMGCASVGCGVIALAVVTMLIGLSGGVLLQQRGTVANASHSAVAIAKLVNGEWKAVR